MNDKIQCPNCSHQFDVEEALSGKLEAQFRKKYEQKIADQAKVFNNEREKLEIERKDFQDKKAKENEIFRNRLAKSLEEQKATVEKAAFASFEAKMKLLEDENTKKKEENKALRAKEVNLMRKENELLEQQENLKLQMEKQMLERQHQIEEKAREKERENFELEKVKLLKQIEDNKKLAEEMKRKAEQGSMQMQGEVQEIALEELLIKTYPFDQIEEVPKGVRGADVIQSVINNLQTPCGKIVYESKRTKHFANDWIEKLKQDQITCKADLAMIVTETLPSDMNSFGVKDGVWICTFQDVKSLSQALREMLIRTESVRMAQDNKGDRMELLYQYLTSNEFAQNIKRIVENYDGMMTQLNSEKKAMYKIWAKREKDIWVVQENIASLFGAIKGIAGNALDSVDVLELPSQEESD